MKKIIYCFIVACLLISVLPVQASAAKTENTSSLVATKPPEPVDKLEIKDLLNSVKVNKSLDKSTLRGKANTQVFEGRHHRRGGTVVYVSGSLVLVILLVIILL